MENKIFLVIKINGEAFRQTRDNVIFEIKPGDSLNEGDIIIVKSGTVEVENASGSPLEFNEGTSFLIKNGNYAEITNEARDPSPAEQQKAEIRNDNATLKSDTKDPESDNSDKSKTESGERSGDGHGFVRLERIDYNADNAKTQFGRDVNAVFSFDGRATLNPRVNYKYIYPEPKEEISGSEYEDLRHVEPTKSGWANRAPVARPDSAVTEEDIPLIINPLENDTDPDGHSLTITTASALFGTVTINADGTITYIPNEDFHGVDTITYTITDNYGGTAESTVNVTVNPVQDAFNDTATTDEDSSVTINVLANDTFGPNAEVTGVTQGAHGTVVINENGEITYIPGEYYQSLAEGTSATDTYTYTVTTAAGNTETATVTVTILGVNDVPVITNDTDQTLGTVAEAGHLDDGTAVTGTATATGDLSASDVDTGATQTWSLTGSQPTTYGTMSVDPATGIWTYTLDNTLAATQALAEGDSVTQTYTVRVTDDFGAYVDQTVTVTINGTNDVPVVTNLPAETAGTVTEAGHLDDGTVVTGTATATGDLSASDVDTGATQTWSLTGSQPTTYGTMSVDPATGIWTYTLDNTLAATQALAEGDSVTQTYTVRVTDDFGAYVDQTVTVTINGTNDVPVVTNLPAETAGTVTEAGHLDDGTVVTGTATATGDLSASDVDTGATQTWSLTGSQPTTYGTMSVDPATGIWTYTLDNTLAATQALAEGDSVTQTYTVRVTDDFGAYVDQTVTVTINGTNDVPVVTNLPAETAGTVTEAGHLDDGTVVTGTATATGDLSASDVDTGATQTWSLTGSQPTTYGTMSVDPATGIWTYTLDNTLAATQALAEGDSVTQTYTVRVTDDFGAYVDQTVTVTINGTNDVPVVTNLPAETAGTVTEAGHLDDGTVVTGTATATGDLSASDVDTGATQTWSLTGSQPTTYGTMSVDPATGIWTYTLDNTLAATQALAEGDSVTQTYTVRVTDDFGAYVDQTVTVTINGTNDVPVVTNLPAETAGTVTEAGHLDDGTVVTGTATATGDLSASDVDTGATQTWSLTGSQPTTYGTMSVDPATGIWTYTLDNTLAATQALAEGDSVTQTYTVRVTDDFGAYVDQTVTVTINGTNDVPVVTNLPAETAGTVTEAGHLDDGTVVTGTATATGDLSASDVDTGATQTWSLTGSQPTTYGTMSVDPATGIWTYTLDNTLAATQALAEGDSVTQTYTVRVTDDFGAYVDQTVTVTINGTNDVPVVTNLPAETAGTVTEAGHLDDGTVVTGTATATGDLSASDVDTGATQTWSLTGSQPTTYGTMSVDPATGIWTYTLDNTLAATQALAEGDSVTQTYTVRVTDDFGAYVDQTVTVTINGTNDVPVVTNLPAETAGTVTEAGHLDDGTVVTGTATATGDLSASDVDTGATQTWSLTGSQPTTYGTMSVDPATGIWTYTLDNTLAATQALAEGDSVTQTYTVRVTDDFGAYVDQTVTVTINGTNDVPVVTNLPAETAGTVTEAGHLDDGTVVTGTATATGDLSASDVDTGATQTWSLTGSQPTTYGTMSVDPATGIWTYTLDNTLAATQALAEGDSVTQTYTVRVTDDFGAYVDQTVTVTINGTNDVPVVTNLPAETAGTVTEAGHLDDGTVVTGTATATGDLSASDVDTGATQTWSLTGSQPTTYGTMSVDPATGIWTYTLDNTLAATQALAEGDSVTQTYTVRVTDDFGAYVDQTVTVTINGTNDVPVVTNLPAETAGTVTEAGHLDDGTVVTGTATATGDLSASDVDTGATQTWSLTGSQPTTYGTMSVDPATGIWTYTLDNTLAATQALAEGDSVTQTYTVRVTDDFGAYVDQTVTVTINGTNDVPVAVADTKSVTEDAADQAGYSDDSDDTTIVVGNVITNDTDVDHLDTRSVTGVAAGTPGSAAGNVATGVAGTYGTVNITSEGTYTYTLDNTKGSVQALALGQTVTDTFTYTITDSQGATSSTTLTITVTGTNDTPDITVGAGDSASAALTETDAGLTASGTLSIFDVDTLDTVTAAKVNSVTVGGTYGGARPTDAALIAMFSASGGDPSTLLQSNPNGIGWNFNSGSQAFNEIPAGQTLILTYTVRATDNNGAFDDQTVTITITGTNDAPVAVADTNSVTEDAADQAGYSDDSDDTTIVVGNVITNDTDVDHLDTRSVTGVAAGTPGSAAGNVATGVAGTYGTVNITSEGTYTYTLDNTKGSVQALALGQTVTDTFTYTITDSQGATSSTTLTITVIGTNDTPVITVGAGDSAAESLTETDAGLSVSGTLSIFDVDTLDTVTAAKVSSVTVGGTYSGPLPDNTALIAMFSASGGDPSTLLQSNPNGISWNFNSGSEAFNEIPAGQTLILTYTVRATDNHGAFDDQTVTITINGTNDAPVAVADTNSVTEDAADQAGYSDGSADTTIVAGNVITNDTDVDHLDTRSVTGVAAGTPASAEGNFAAGVAGTYGTVNINADGTYTYALDNTKGSVQALAVGQTVTDTFTYTITDSQGATSSTTLTITVIGTNDTPVITVGAGDSAAESLTETDAGLSVSGTLSIFDVDTLDTVTAAKVSSVTVGGTYSGPLPDNTALIAMFSASGGDPSTLLQSNPNGISWNFNSGSEAFNEIPAGQTLILTYTVRATDNHGAFDDQTVTITINGTNDAPVAVADTNSVTEDAADQTGYNDSNSATTIVAGNVITNDTDVDHLDTRSVTGVAAGTPASAEGNVAAGVAGTYGTVNINADGTYTYALDNTKGSVQALAVGQTVTDTFTYTITDSQGATSSTTLTITVIGTNDTPVITVGAGDSAAESLTETDAGLSVSGTLSIFDVDTLDTVTAAKVSSVTVGGTYSGPLPDNTALIAMFSASGGDPSTLLQSNPNGISWNFNSGSEAFNEIPAGQTLILTYTVRATDNHGAFDDQTVTITINGTNDEGSIIADVANVNEDNVLTGNVLDNDIPDPDYNEPLSVTGFTVDSSGDGNQNSYLPGNTAIITTASGGLIGTLRINANGSYTFIPQTNYSGPVPVVTYTAGNATFSESSTLTITVNPVSDTPGVNADNTTLQTPEDTAISLGLNLPTISDTIDQNGALPGDNPELLGPITLSGIPSGAILLDGTNADNVLWTSNGSPVTIFLSDQPGYHINGAAGTLTLTTAQYEALKVLPPVDSGTNFTVTASVTSYEVDDLGTPIAGVPGATGTTSVFVDVLAVTDDVEIKINGSDTHSVTINEDSQLDLSALLTKNFSDTDGSEQRSIILGNLPQGTIINGTVIGVSGTITIPLTGGNTIPAITLTPPSNFSGDIMGITITLRAQDTDSDSSHTPAVLTDTVTLDLYVDPVAGDIGVTGVSTAEDTGVNFLTNLAVTDTDGSETITAITVKGLSADWVIRDAGGTVVHTGDGIADFTIDAADVADGDYLNYTLTPPYHSSADGSVTIAVQTTDTQTVNGTPVTSTVTTDLSIPVIVTPVAEVVGGDSNGDGISDLTMTPGYVYSVPASEDTWFEINQDGFDFKAGWNNQDPDEATYAMLTPLLNGGASSATGSQFRYYDGTTTITLTYTGTPLAIPVQYLDTVEFKAASNISGMFEIQIQAKTVDTDPDTATTSTAVSGSATISNLLVQPVADQVTLSVSSPATGLEDTQIPIRIRATSSDPSETFNITISGIPAGSSLTYNGILQTVTGGSVTIENFDRSAPLSILPPVNSNEDFVLNISAVSVDTYGSYTDISAPMTLPVNVSVRGVADPAIIDTVDPSTTEAVVDGNGHQISLSSVITNAQLTDTDGSEKLTMTLTGLGSEFTVSGAAFMGGAGTGRIWLVDPAQLGTTNIISPPNFSGTINLSVRAVTTENDGNSLTGSAIPIAITVAPSPEATIVSSTTTNEDTLVRLNFDIIYQNGDNDETLTSVWIKADDVEGKDFNLYFGNSTDTPLSGAVGTPGVELDGGYYKLTGSAINNIYAKGAANTDGVYNFETKYEITDPSSDGSLPSVTTQTDSSYTLTVRAVTDPTEIVLDNITPDNANATVIGNVVTATGNTSISIDVSVNPLPDANANGQPDTDGSEKLVRFIIDGVPDGITVRDGIYIGDTPENPNTGRWLVEVDPDVSIVGTVTKTLVFDLDGTAAQLENLNEILTITAVSQDTGSFLQVSSQTWTLVTSDTFDDSGAATDLPAEITANSFTPLTTANEDAPINLNALVDFTIDGNSPFSVTLTGLPAGTEVTGMLQTTVNGETIWTASGTGGNAVLQSLLSGITVTPPPNWNDNNNQSGIIFDTVLTTYAPGGQQNVEHVIVTQPIIPVTDPTDLAVTAPTVSEGTSVPVTITLSNSADGSAANIVDGKLYLSLNETDIDNTGTLLYGGSPLATQAVSGIAGIPDGTYYVIEGISDISQTISLTYQPSAYASGQATLTALLLSQETNATNVVTSTETEILTVAPVNSGFDITTNNISGTEDARIPLSITGSGLADTDGSESIMAVTLGNVPNGYLVFSGTDAASATLASNLGEDLGGNKTWSIPLIGGALPGYIAILPPLDYSGTVEGLTLTVLSGEYGLTTNENTSSFSLEVIPVADGLTIAPTNTFGLEGDQIALNLNASMVDSDGSETVTLSVAGLGGYAAFFTGTTPISAAYDAGTDTYTLSGITADDIDDLSFVQSARTGTIDVTAYTVETANSDISGSVSSSFSLNISPIIPTAGDDTLLYDGARSFDGLDGNDTIVMRLGESINFDTDPLIRNIEAIDLRGSGDNSIQNLSVQDVIDVTDSNNYLTIYGDSNDSVNIIDDGNWTQTTQTEGSLVFDVYTNSAFPDVTLRIQQEIMNDLI